MRYVFQADEDDDVGILHESEEGKLFLHFSYFFFFFDDPNEEQTCRNYR